MSQKYVCLTKRLEVRIPSFPMLQSSLNFTEWKERMWMVGTKYKPFLFIVSYIRFLDQEEGILYIGPKFSSCSKTIKVIIYGFLSSSSCFLAAIEAELNRAKQIPQQIYTLKETISSINLGIVWNVSAGTKQKNIQIINLIINFLFQQLHSKTNHQLLI